jgi:Lrp/AsnC family leucine-responsive transcriptional regulator
MNLDTIDLHILKLLQQNAKMSIKEIADTVGLSVTPTYERMKKIEGSGLIKSTVALLDADLLDRNTVVFCSVSLQVHNIKAIQAFEKAIQKITEVLECHHITGQYDYLLKVVVHDMKAYQYFLTHKLAVIENIAQVHSNFVMSAVKYTTALPL